ncbi:hypothetical protein WJX73_009615 [Symbiochloris irregularis]|uniref:Uncharacterized protein n=1 Tax=Symbiochloris irregularis TaxID=706552 RepID=A0AAW1NXC4_9CHLO
MSAKQKRAVPGTAWPELSKSDLRTLLRDIGVKTSEFEQAKTKAIRELFAKTLAKAHSLPLLADCLGTLDPESMTKCDPEDLRAGFSFAGPDTGKKTAYLETLRAQELMEAEPDNSFLHYRMRLHILGEEYWEGAISAALMRHEESELAILLNIKDMRIGPDGTPLLMVSFVCVVGPANTAELYQAFTRVRASCLGLSQYQVKNRLGVQLLKEVLLSNAARLTPDYKQRCRREL